MNLMITRINLLTIKKLKRNNKINKILFNNKKKFNQIKRNKLFSNMMNKLNKKIKLMKA